MAESKYKGKDLARENYSRFVRGRDAGHRRFIEDSLRFENYYIGEQWDSAVKAKLEAEGRPAMTVNFILPTVNAIVGEFSNRQADFQYKPKKGGATEESAHAMSKLAMHICQANAYDALEKEMVEDGLISGRGYLDVRADFEDNILGEVRMRALDPREVVLDVTAREYDPSTWNEVMTTRWLSLDEVAVLYGEAKAEELRYYYSSGELFSDDSVRWEERSTYGDDKAFDIGALDDVNTGRTLRQVRIIERQYYKLARIQEFVDPVNGDTRPVPKTWSAERIALYQQVKNLQVRSRLTRKIRWTTSADCVLLHDEWSPYPTFSVIPFFCYFRRGKPFGAVKNLINPQDIFNKTQSQMLHVVNTTANSGWIVESGALMNMSVQELSQKGAETGLILEVAPGKEVAKITPNTVPSGLDRVGMLAADSIQTISGVNSAMLGTEGGEVSGVTLENRQLRGSLQLQTVMDNLRRTREILGRKILELVQLFYTEERVFHIIGHEGETEELLINAQNAVGEIINDLTIGEYGLVVGSMPARDNYEETQFAQAMQMREAGILVPDHWVIQTSNMARKAELVELVKQATGFGEASPEQQQMAQMELQMMQAQLDDLLADIGVKQATAEFTLARAQSEADKPMLEREKLSTDLTITQEEQSVRMAVQRLKELSGQMKSLMDNQTRIRQAAQQSKERAQQRRTSNVSGKRQ